MIASVVIGQRHQLSTVTYPLPMARCRAAHSPASPPATSTAIPTSTSSPPPPQHSNPPPYEYAPPHGHAKGDEFGFPQRPGLLDIVGTVQGRTHAVHPARRRVERCCEPQGQQVRFGSSHQPTQVRLDHAHRG